MRSEGSESERENRAGGFSSVRKNVQKFFLSKLKFACGNPTNDAKNLPATFVGPVTFVFIGVGVRLQPYERLWRGVSTFYV